LKVKSLQIQAVKVPLDKPIPSGKMVIHSADALLITLRTKEHFGEGMVFTLNGVRLNLIREMILSLENLIIDRDIRMHGELIAQVWRELVFLGQRGVGAIALSAIDSALWDLKAKHADQNVSQLIGVVKTTIPMYRSGSLRLSASIPELQNEAQALVKEGFKAIKMSLGSKKIADDVARIKAVRQAIGDGIELMTDCNQQLTVSHAIRLGRQLEEFQLAWIEEPVIFNDHYGEAQIAAALDTPIASGENEFTALGMIEKSADILMPDLQRMGGPTELLKVAHLAQAANIAIAPHLFTQISLPLAATMTNAIYVEYMPWFSPLYQEQLILNLDGTVNVPKTPGWGFNFDQKAVQQFLY
jgi:L-alanine-DL-glutamate epimerase-like enolase superfamily enzyme